MMSLILIQSNLIVSNLWGPEKRLNYPGFETSTYKLNLDTCDSQMSSRHPGIRHIQVQHGFDCIFLCRYTRFLPPNIVQNPPLVDYKDKTEVCLIITTWFVSVLSA